MKYDPTKTTPYNLAKQLTALKAQFHHAWTTYYHNLPLLHTERFWTLLTNLQYEVQTYQFQYARTNGIQDATNEFFRKTITQESTKPPVPNPYHFEEALHFARTWTHISHTLDQKFTTLITGYGDDSYHDLLDALPLAGKQICENTYTTFQELQGTLQGLGEKFAHLILHGENYIHTYLEQAAKKWYLHQVIDAATTQDLKNNLTTEYQAED